MDIDVVYTWVDGNDPEWQKRKDTRLQELGYPVSETANHSCRFIEHDELKYSLRSIYTFAPWVHKIYIVTDKQIPAWFNTENPWVTIVDHTELFDDPDCLPTYNASALETKLHKIPNLSEHYLYFNDDFFLGRKCTPHDFVQKNKPCIYVEKRNTLITQKKFDAYEKQQSLRNEFQAGMRNSRNLIIKTYGKKSKVVLSHGIRVYRKSTMSFLNNEYKEYFDNTAAHPFRSFSDILSYAIFSFYTLVTKTGIAISTPQIRGNRYFFNNLINRHRKYLYKHINLSSKNLYRSLRNIKKYKHFMFCINDERNTREEAYITAQDFLRDFFPEKSPAASYPPSSC